MASNYLDVIEGLHNALSAIVARFEEQEAVGISTDEYEAAQAALEPSGRILRAWGRLPR